MSEVQPVLLEKAYHLLSELWCSPRDVDVIALRKDTAELIEESATQIPHLSHALRSFLESPAISETDYIHFFELEPECPLYLGSHTFEEPQSCAGAVNCDRTQYMLELGNYYRHFGLSPDSKELPDYLPLMLDFLAVTAEQTNETPRQQFIEKGFLPYLPAMGEKLRAINESYYALWQAMNALLTLESSVDSSHREGECHAG